MDVVSPTIDGLLDRLGAHEREAAGLALAMAGLEVSGEWAADGAASFAAWLRHHGRLSNADAREWQRRGRFLRRFPAIADAAVSGVLSAGQVDLIRNACPTSLQPILSEQQHALVQILAPLDVADTQRALHIWNVHATALIDTPPAAERDRQLRFGPDSTGAIVGTFVLPGQAGTELAHALRTAITWDGNNDTRTSTEKNADALFDIAAFYNKNHNTAGTPRHLPHVERSLDASTLHDTPIATDADGRIVDPVTTDTLLCNCAIHQILREDHIVLGYGRARYTVPKLLFRAVAARDGGCRYPGCDRPVRFCDAHHIRHWRHGGTTDHDNLLLLCSRHHHHIHKHELNLKLLPDATVEITWPDSHQRTSRPRGRPPTIRAA